MFLPSERRLAMDETVMMRPHCCSIIGLSAARADRNAALTLTAMTRSQSASVSSKKVRRGGGDADDLSQNVEPAIFRQGAGDHILHVGFGGDIGLNDQRLAAFAGDQ